MLNTNQKINIAKVLSTLVRAPRALFGLPTKLVARRRGIVWALDLKEGIDLSIYVLGGFEIDTLKRYSTLVKSGDVVLDIGANIGAHTLPLAHLVGAGGKVYAFEPTDFAFSKLEANMALNPALAGRIHANQVMLMASGGESMPASVYSSWPLEAAKDLHTEHAGRLMPTSGARPMTLDRAVESFGLSRVDFVKLDVDGNENAVLTGGHATLARFKPAILMELAPYVYRGRLHEFDGMLDMLTGMGYSLVDASSGKALPTDPARMRSRIPIAGGINVLARQADATH